MRIQVKDFMSSPVATATGKNTVGEIRKLMERKKIHAIPIIEYIKKLPEIEVKIKGIVTSTDLNVELNDQLAIEDFMTQNLFIIHQHSSAQAAAKMMMKRKVHHLIVMEDGKIIGIISSLDFVKLVAEHALVMKKK